MVLFNLLTGKLGIPKVVAPLDFNTYESCKSFHVLYVYGNRSCAEEALRLLNGTQLGGQSIRLSWGRSPSNKQVHLAQFYSVYLLLVMLIATGIYLSKLPSSG